MDLRTRRVDVFGRRVADVWDPLGNDVTLEMQKYAEQAVRTRGRPRPKMTVTAPELARRLRSARESCRMRAEEVARRLGLPCSAIVQIEGGQRAVSSVELDQLAYLYGRDAGDFLASEFPAENPLTTLVRLGEADDEELEAARRTLVLRRAVTDLERVLGVEGGSEIETAHPTRLPAPDAPSDEADLRRRILSFGIEALRREAISRGKMRELSRLIGLDEEELEDLLERVGLAPPPLDLGPAIHGRSWNGKRAGSGCRSPPSRSASGNPGRSQSAQPWRSRSRTS